MHEYLKNLLDEKHLNKSEIIKQSGLNREYAYHIIEGNRKNPSRPKVLAIGMAMGLNLDEMQYLLKYAKQNPLYPRDPWDSVIIFAIEQRLNVLETRTLTTLAQSFASTDNGFAIEASFDGLSSLEPQPAVNSNANTMSEAIISFMFPNHSQ